MGDLVVGLAKSVVEGVLTKAQSAIEEESKLRLSVQRDLVFIAGEFEMMHSFLNVANEERAKNSVVRTWVRQVRDLAYDVEDCIESVVHLDSKPNWWRRLLPSCMAGAALPLDVVVTEIEQIKARVEDVSRRNSRYSLISDSGSKPVMQKQPAASTSIGAAALDTLIEARDSTKKQQGLGDLTQLITKENNDLGVISVWGIGGDLGRTSVIRKAYQDPEICQNFRCRGWVKLTHPFDAHKFLQSLMAQFYTNSCLQEGTTVDVAELKRMEMTTMIQGGLTEEFMKQLKEKRYLLVLENVCTMGEWDAIRACLPDRKKGNWIIVSTELHEIASLCIGYSYQVLELKQYSAEYPVCVFFKEGSQGKETGRVMSSNNEISYDRIPTSKKDVASSWISQFSLVGHESQMNELRNCQTKARFNDWQVMSVWGIAGVGKSDLVRNLYYERMLQKDPIFDKYGWVQISHPFNLRDFSRSLLLDLDSVSIEAMGIKDPIQECHKLLKEHQCLVVIDDLQSTEEWDLIQPALVSRHSKSVIIVITTEEKIGTYCADNGQVVFNVKCLEAEASVDLFKKQVQKKNQASPLKSSNDRELEQLIVKCGRLPKVIVSVADFLAPKTVTCMDSTRTLNHRFMHELESNPEFGGLRGLFGWMHSYFRTCPDFLRPCIFYMSIFPGSQIIRRRRLVMRWVAEGYARDTKDTTAEEKGEVLFSMLVNLSMIQPPQCTVIAHMRMVLCQVSAFFHEYIISRPEEENIIFALEVFALKGRCLPTTRRTGRHLVIEDSWDRDRIVFESIDFSRLRSLTVLGKWESFFISKSMKVLRVLDLENARDVSDKDLKQMVKLLPRLKFLSLRGRSEICHLPSSLGELRQLETLDVRGTSIVTLPASITKLNKLQYIRAGKTSRTEESSTPCPSRSWLPNLCRSRQLVGVEVPKGIDKLTALNTLGVVNADIAWGKDTLKELRKLTQLRKLGVSGINKKNYKEFCAAISNHVRLESLSVWLGKGNQDYLDNISSPPENLQSFKLYGLIKKVPAWIKDLPRLTKLDLEIAMSEEVDMIKVLGEIKELCILRLCVKPLQDGDCRLDFCVWVNGQQQRCYSKVKILEIACSSKVNVSFGSEAMQNLELLMVHRCSGSTFEFTELKNLSKLKLKEVRLMGSHDNTLKEDMEKQLKEHPRKPALKLEEPYSS
ncbi:disease resistance protein Pik-2-like isoform X2 [Phragmites australis]|nr:disease resistance protein Pik-2-like isoform X2 [Phragmites australis]XP_062198020.1 disease resistance protein Pik-2-like isoform X2 [Phragmites australis]XP_062198021.1 disease resistance protein Pik-2-like isoform X2 [Phragmites australis]XP_062198022.1 disease resistance protein Pik-2-like isoform X2 [Phragmites australis]